MTEETVTISEIEDFIAQLTAKIAPLKPSIAASVALGDIHAQLDPLVIEIKDIISDATANMAEAREAGELLQAAIAKGAECMAKGDAFVASVQDVLARISAIHLAISDNADAIGEAVGTSPVDEVETESADASESAE